MKRKTAAALLAVLMMLMLCGCLRKDTYRGETLPTVTRPVAETTEPVPVETVPADGNPDDVTCKGSYTGAPDLTAEVAKVSDARLTNGQLQVWYWAAVAQYRQEQHEDAPDFDKPLDTQECPIDDSVNSWQQYFLKQALNAWHNAQAMQIKSQKTTLKTEAAYKPNVETHKRCMTGMPAAQFLYGNFKTYQHNTLHRTYLDGIPGLLEQLAGEKGYADTAEMAKAAGSTPEELEAFAGLYNEGYMYLTYLSYSLAPGQKEIEDWFSSNRDAYAEAGITEDSGSLVDFRQILLLPESPSDADVRSCEKEAKALLKQWKEKTEATEAAFSELAFRHSQDAGTAAGGGIYRGADPEQLPGELKEWFCAAGRKAGDTAVITTEQGVHIVLFSGAVPLWQAEAEADLTAHMEQELIGAARTKYPMKVNYSAISLTEGEGSLSFADVLYPDIAHQRYPEVPLYLQQDYPNTWYGSYKISSHGCGITTFSMLMTYMSDEEWTPPEMCDRYGSYSYENGTDGMIFIRESSKYGAFFREKTYDPKVAREALEEGLIVVCIQHKGYWTSGGHYILFEKLTGDGMVQVRDSNIANYQKLKRHKQDKHTWSDCVSSGAGYWIFEKKAVTTEACVRCGTPDQLTRKLLQGDYTCEKCTQALLRRSVWLENKADS